ncbi:MAG: hypothetical protein H0U74_14350 [Bradymonadaceae bacterium]|nr:hypothetical protein [Lujinxingiaceae bacterium]
MTEQSSSPTTAPIQEILTVACLRIEKAMLARFRAYLKPGERLRASIEKDKDFVYAQLVVALPDQSFRLDLEAAVVVQDQDFDVVQAIGPEERIELAFEFLRTQLHDYFRHNRVNRFHLDWRIYPFETTRMRFRGRLQSPDLEAMANELLGEALGDDD